jgi:hypothetical protein
MDRDSLSFPTKNKFTRPQIDAAGHPGDEGRKAVIDRPLDGSIEHSLDLILRAVQLLRTMPREAAPMEPKLRFIWHSPHLAVTPKYYSILLGVCLDLFFSYIVITNKKRPGGSKSPGRSIVNAV